MDRNNLINSFLTLNGWSKDCRQPLAADASFRKYERLYDGVKAAVLMDAPPEHEKIKPFIRIAAYLQKLGLSSPKIFAKDIKNGLLLLEDFGDDTYSKILDRQPELAGKLYSLASDTLIHIQKKTPAELKFIRLNEYTVELMIREACLILEWFCFKTLNHQIPVAMRRKYVKLWNDSLAIVRRQPLTLVLRDYHVDNLMLLENREGILSCGLLDFQDAVFGPGIYDLVSLLEDARRDISRELKCQIKLRYYSELRTFDVWKGSKSEFELLFSTLGAQRHTKVIGIFSRLALRDKKYAYLKHLPRVWSLLETSLENPALFELKQWFDEMIPKKNRTLTVNKLVKSKE